MGTSVLSAFVFMVVAIEISNGEAFKGRCWGGRKTTCQIKANLSVSPKIPHRQKPTFVIKFDKPIKGIQIWQADVLRMENGNKDVVLKYKYGGGIPAGNKAFQFQVKCQGAKATCPTDVNACFISPANQANVCGNGGNGGGVKPTEPTATDPPTTQPPATKPPGGGSGSGSGGVSGGAVWPNDEATLYYGSANGNIRAGNCGFVSWPEHAVKNYVAIPTSLYNKGQMCGACIRMERNGLEAVTIVTDHCGGCKGSMSSAHRHWDMAPDPFFKLTKDTPGPGHYDGFKVQLLDSCPSNIVTGNMGIYIDDDNGWSFKVQPVKACSVVTDVQIIKDGSAIDLVKPKGDYYFVFGAGPGHSKFKPLNPPFVVRTTSKQGKTLDVNVAKRVAGGSITDATGNNCA